MIDRDALTKVFLRRWGKSMSAENVRYYSRKWWRSVRASKIANYRLSDSGFAFVTETLQLISYRISIPEPIRNPQDLIFIDKYVDCPYYLQDDAIIVFSEKKGAELSFFSDDIGRYGLAKAMNARA